MKQPLSTLIALAGALPTAGFWDGQEAFQRILGQAPRILLASFLAYLAGEFVNAYVLARLKVATQGRMLWLRTIGSTLIGQALDSAIFMTVAFAAGDRDAGFRWLAKACDERCFEMITLKVDPRFDGINSDPRFAAAATRVGLS